MTDTHFASQYPEDARFTQIKQIISFVKEGNSSQVIGLPGAGKSNVLELLAYNKKVRLKHLGEEQTNYHFVFTNFAEMKGKPLIEVIKFLFSELVDSLEERDFTDIYQTTKKLLKESLAYQDELLLFQGLKKAIDYVTGAKGLTIVFLFYRFETYIPAVTAEFFSNLRILRNRAKYKFSVVFSLNRPLDDVIEPNMFADFYELLAGNTIFVPLEDIPVRNFRISHLEQVTGKKISKQYLDQILTITAGHGKLLRVCLETVLAQEQQALPLTLNYQFFSAQKSIVGALLEIWYYLLPHEQVFLLQLPGKDTPTPIFLEQIGLVKENTVTIPIFQTFLAEQGQTLAEKKQAIIYDPTTNTIMKGSLLLSDKLTVSEFRLLRFLLEHPETIVDRENIISAVWKDAKATAGVTDQAVDQLIFRLRKKIEDDPNNPIHLQTVKGRGVKFSV